MNSEWTRHGGLVVLMALAWAAPSLAQDTDTGELAREEAREAEIISRFVTVLEQNPRRGTALDKVYGHHVERGSLETLIKAYREKAESARTDEAASGWMIVGLLESLRGQDAIAVKAFEDAERLASDNYLASYYLGQSLVLLGQPDKGAEALERAVARKPAQADLLDVFQALGRVYQRAQKTNKALDVWNRLEQQFPNDVRVQEQIATTLLEEGEFAAALPRFENLIKVTKDKYRQSLFQMEAAEIKVRLGKNDEAIKEFERLLSQLNPDHWLFREVRRRIEAVFLRTEDRAGLAAYYETWLKKNPEDLEAVSRLARLYSSLSRGEEAQAWLERGLKVAPSRKELRLSLINHLLYEQQFGEAIAQYEQLDKYEPNNPDTLRDWGRLILKDTTRDAATRKRDAAIVWHKLIATRPKDPFVASQVGELFRHAEMTDEALELYQRAVELAPEAAQYREYLGEYYHALNRKDDALATWRQIAEGKLKTAPNLSRLAEVMAGFGYLTEAVETNAAACQLDPKDFNLQLKHVDLLSRADQHEDALKQLALVRKLAANDEEREAWLRRDLQELQALDRLKARISEVRKEVEEPGTRDQGQRTELADKWFWLARAHEAERQMKEAARAVTKASELSPQSIPILMASARIHEAQNNLLAAVEINTKLAAIDRRYRTEYLKQVATLEQKLGRRDKALQAGRDLLAAAPGNPELYEFFSQLCFQLGEKDEGLQALRRSVRVNPHDLRLLMRLASALAERNQPADAIELFWRAFEKSTSLDERLGIVQQLAQVSAQTKQVERLFERLERGRREPGQQREMTLCLAQAHQTTGNDAQALKELETLLTEGTRDTMLLAQLRKLSEKQNQWEAAIRYQRQLWQITQDKGDRFQLAQLLMKSGQVDDAIELLASAAQTKELTPDVLKLIDSLQDLNQIDAVLARLKPLRERFPNNWELLYREGAALAEKQPDAAIQRFETLLALNCSEDDPSLVVTNNASVGVRYSTTRLPLIERTQAIAYFQRAAAAQPARVVSGGRVVQSTRQAKWMPHNYGTARVAAWGSLLNLARKQKGLEEFMATTLKRLEQSPTRQSLEDRYFLATLVGDMRQKHQIARELAQQPDAGWDAKVAYIQSLATRRSAAVTTANGTRTSPAPATPLDAGELKEVVAVYREIAARPELIPYNVMLIPTISVELNIAGDAATVESLFTDAVGNVISPIEVAMLFSQAASKNDATALVRLLDRLIEFERQPVAAIGTSYAQTYMNSVLSSDNRANILVQFINRKSATLSLEDMQTLWQRFVRLEALQLTRRLKQPGVRTAQSARLVTVQFEQTQPDNLVSVIYGPAASNLLSQIHTLYTKKSAGNDLVEVFQRELQAPDLSGDERMLWLHGLGHLYWHDGKKASALAAFAGALELAPDRLDLRLHLAALYEKTGEQSRGLDLVDNLVPDSTETMLDCERLALRLALNTNRLDRAKVAAERLFAAKLPPQELIPLAGNMVRLGMHDQAEALLTRVGGQTNSDLRAMTVLMEIQLARDKTDEAAATARQLLQQLERQPRAAYNPATYQTQSATSSRVVLTRVSTPPINVQQYREHAYRVLHQTGKLAEMIELAESQLKESPNSVALVDALIGYHTAADHKERVEELKTKRLEIEVNVPANRYALSLRLLQEGRTDEAVRQMGLLIQKDPDYFVSRSREIVFRFESKNALPELAKLFDQTDWSAFDKQPQVSMILIESLLARPATHEVAIRWFHKEWQARPERRIELLHHLTGDELWELPQIVSDLRRVPIPASEAAVAKPWSSFGCVLKKDADGTNLVTVLSRILTEVSRRKELDAMAADVEKAIAQWPNWTAGKVLLALIDLRRGRVESARDELERLLPTLGKSFQNSPSIPWEIAQELVRHETSFDTGVRFFELAVQDGGLSSWNVTGSPVKALIQVLVERDRKPAARRLLLQSVPAALRSDREGSQSTSAADVEIAQSVGRELRNLGYPIDAIHVYHTALRHSERMTISGYDPRVQLQSSLAFAFGELKAESLADHLAAEGNAPANLDLLLFHLGRGLAPARVATRWQQLLEEIAQQPEVLARTRSVLTAIREKQPLDATMLVLSAHLAFTAKAQDESSALVHTLLRFAEEHPLPELSELPALSGAQREVIARQMGLWLIARTCLRDESLSASGRKLGERALQAARFHPDSLFSIAMLKEWIAIADEVGDSATAERLRTRLMYEQPPQPAAGFD